MKWKKIHILIVKLIYPHLKYCLISRNTLDQMHPESLLDFEMQNFDQLSIFFFFFASREFNQIAKTSTKLQQAKFWTVAKLFFFNFAKLKLQNANC